MFHLGWEVFREFENTQRLENANQSLFCKAKSDTSLLRVQYLVDCPKLAKRDKQVKQRSVEGCVGNHQIHNSCAQTSETISQCSISPPTQIQPKMTANCIGCRCRSRPLFPSQNIPLVQARSLLELGLMRWVFVEATESPSRLFGAGVERYSGTGTVVQGEVDL